jgi:hypothetical protein
VAANGSSSGDAGVSAKGRPTPSALCAAEGRKRVRGKAPFGQCVAGVKKLDKGKVRNPRAACKGLSKKKTRGTKGKSPHAVCIKAAAKLMAAAKPMASKPGDDLGGSEAGPSCSDADGNLVPADDPDVEECLETGAASADDESPDAEDSSSDEDDEPSATADEPDENDGSPATADEPDEDEEP